jgi:predicted DNA-binding transcriptional regulator AlpA
MTNTATAPPPFLTESQAASRLALSGKTLRNWRAAGVGPGFLKLGSAVRYHQSQLDAWALDQVAA